MKDYLSRYPLVFIFCCFAAGIWLQDRLGFSLLFLLSLFFLILILLVIFSRSKILPIFLGLTFLNMGQLSIIFWQHIHLEHFIVAYFPLEKVNARGELFDPPEKDRKTGVIIIDHIYVANDTIKIQKKFIFKFPKDFPEMLPGDILIFQNVSLSHLDKSRNPGQFDFSTYLRMQGVIGQIISTDFSNIEFIPLSRLFSIRRSIFLMRQTIDRQFYRFMDERIAGFLSAILLGKKEGIQPDIMLDFQRGGVAHVIAISGLNVGFIVFILLIVLSFFPISFRLQNVAAIFLLVIHMLLTGANPPVVRATIMIIIYLLGIILQRKPEVYNTLFFAGFLFLLYHPQDLYSLSFQFSFLAVLTMLLFYEKFKPLEKKISEKLPEGKFFRKIILAGVQLFLVSLAAQIGTIPLTAIHFKQLPIISLVLNLIVIPLLGFITPIGFIILFSALFSMNLARIVSYFLSFIVVILFKVVHLAANFPGAYIRILAFDELAFFIYLTIIMILFSFTSGRIAYFRKVFIAVAVILILWKIAPSTHQPQLLMMDVGQGESTLLITPTAKKVLFDAGSASDYWDSGTKVIYPVLLELGISRLDKVILSHPHSDHVGGIFSLLNNVTIDSIFLPDVKIQYFWQDSLLTRFRRKGIPYRFIQMGDQIKIDPVSRIYILAPTGDQLQPPDASGKSLNNTSLVSLVNISGTTVLFTGDTESDVEKDLLIWNTFLKADILKVGHHGSITSSSYPFLHKISPQIALIPVGKDNKFDHPSPEVLQRLNKLNIPYYRTDLQGAIWLIRTQPAWEVRNWD
ncbi:MAG: DNA internalization-related competence protein ComEC/Rec2 [Caldithrix sp. RBG_13_44_9]|nr:MAG: DNA internalization-related competence protein ComEC/Rec2 [Caldithrix sp. RBG_13_44_9]